MKTRNLKKLSLTLVFTFFMTLLSAQNQIVFVSPGGDDNAAGNSSQTALKTIEKAQMQIRKLFAAGIKDSIIVNISPGTYPVTKPLIFTDEDSPPEGKALVFRGDPSGKTLLNGGENISGWKPYKNGIWVAKVPKAKTGGRKFRQLFVNDSLRTRARILDTGFYRVAGFPDGGPEVHYHTDCQRFQYAGNDINPKWKNLSDVEVIVYHFWTDSHLPIQSIDSKNRIVNFKHKAGKVFTDDFTKNGARYIVENVWEGLDSPGEWYLDQKKGELFYIPMPGENMQTAEVIAPLTPDFVRMEGKPVEGRFVSNIIFENLEFRYTNWDLPLGNSNDDQGSASVPAAITLKGARNCAFKNCNVSKVGTFAFDIGEGSQDIKISDCNLTNLGAGGIRINGGGPNAHPQLRTQNNILFNNTISGFGQVFPSAVGILVMNSANNTIKNNEIAYGNYTGISLGWSWGYHRSISTHNLIEYNYIHHIGIKGLLSDMGGIYTLGVSPGTVIRNNIIHDVNANHYGGWGIYNDEGSSHILIENNLVYNTKFAPYNIHFAKELIVRNNIFALGKLEQLNRTRLDPHKSVFLENNIIYWKTGELLTNNWNDKSYSFYGSALGEPKEIRSTFESDYNLFFNPTTKLESIKFNGDSFKAWQNRGKDMHSIFADPLFIDPERFDFRLKPESPVYKLGFNPIDFSKVGVLRE